MTLIRTPRRAWLLAAPLRERRAAGPGGLCALALLAALAGCASQRDTGDASPTLRSLSGRQLSLPADAPLPAGDGAAIAAYRDFLDKAPQDAARPEALRRLGDLELEGADARAAQAPGGRQQAGREPTHARAAALYEDLLRRYPQAPDADHVLYQLAHAYEAAGQLELALATLERLLVSHPASHYVDEARFRRGELLFTLRRYDRAEQAYAELVETRRHTPYFERALYMLGWARYKQGHLEDALAAYFNVLDLKLIGREGAGGLEQVGGLSRADRELLEDTLRVVSLCLAGLHGADSIPEQTASGLRRDYEVRIYEELGALYLRQERVKDAADVYLAFGRRNPLHDQAPQLHARVVDIYGKAGFDALALATREDFVARYGADSAFARQRAAAWRERVRPVLREQITVISQHYHAAAQKDHREPDYAAAVRGYRSFLDTFPGDPQAPQANFLLAELLFEQHRYAAAAPEYEKTAYQYLPHARSADAGYAALLAYGEQLKAAEAAQRPEIEHETVESALRFSSAFPADPRAGTVMVDASARLYRLGDLERARRLAGKALERRPPLAQEERRTALRIAAFAAFDTGDFASSEVALGDLLSLTAPADPARPDLVERRAAAVYRQGEQARTAGRLAEAVGHFDRLAELAPASPIRANAQFDAAAGLIALKDWAGAARHLEDFRTRYPGHPLQAQVGSRLAFVYTESGQWARAAAEIEKLSAAATDPAMARSAQWQAAELYDKDPAAGDAALAAYTRYIQRYPSPLEPALEARQRLAQRAAKAGDGARALSWQRELVKAEAEGGSERSDRSRALAAPAALALAAPAWRDYQAVALVEPLKKQLKLKKARMEEVLQAYARAADYGVPEVSTEAAWRTAETYQDFSKSMLASERPKGLEGEALEQYNVLLEEQAFPFEEKAVALHEANARHSAEGVRSPWVRDSLAALAKLRPLRYGKTEHAEEVVDAIR